MSSTTTSGNTTVTTTVVQFIGPTVTVADATGSLGFFGKTPVVQVTSAAVTDYASLKVALQSYGLIGA